jgi:hypothetical protein
MSALLLAADHSRGSDGVVFDVRFDSWSRWFLGLVFVVWNLFESFFIYFGVSYSSLESVFLVWSQLQASYFGVSYYSLE